MSFVVVIKDLKKKDIKENLYEMVDRIGTKGGHSILFIISYKL